MNKGAELFIRTQTIDCLKECVADDYVKPIMENIIDDVIEDVLCCADIQFMNIVDIRLAIGRTLIKKLGIEI
jgi:hypothetical protein